MVGMDRAASLETHRGATPACLAARFAGRGRDGRGLAARTGRHPDRLVPVGDAPNWTGRAEGLKRLTEGRACQCRPLAAVSLTG